MRILVIGGTGFIGPPLVRQLAAMGHSVAVFHRGNAQVELPAEHILGDRRDLPSIRPAADVVIDLILSSGAQANALMQTFRGAARRVVAASSIDVYRACGVLHGSEEGPLEPVPLTEDSPLRTKLQTYPPQQIKMLKTVFGWLDDEYDKIPVERAILGDPDLPGTVLRLPMIYGPGDRLRRFHPVLKRIDDGRRSNSVRRKRGRLALAARVRRERSRGAGIGRSVRYRSRTRVQRRGTAGILGARVGAPDCRRDRVDRRIQNAAQGAHARAFAAAGEYGAALGGGLDAHSPELGYREIVPLDEAIRRTVEWERANPPLAINPQQFDYAAEDAAM